MSDALRLQCNACLRVWDSPDPFGGSPIEPAESLVIRVTVYVPERGCWRCHDIAERVARALMAQVEDAAQQMLARTSVAVACGCGAWCTMAEWGAGPCWGTVEAVEEVDDGEGGHYFVHACEGHAEAWRGGEYVDGTAMRMEEG